MNVATVQQEKDLRARAIEKGKTDKIVVETFTDGTTGNTRQYEKNINLDINVQQIASKNGFKLLEKKPLPNDQYQWLYFYRVT